MTSEGILMEFLEINILNWCIKEVIENLELAIVHLSRSFPLLHILLIISIIKRFTLT